MTFSANEYSICTVFERCETANAIAWDLLPLENIISANML
jgi:hypothetical protein